MPIISFSGSAGSGKDTLAATVAKQLEQHQQQVKSLAFAKRLKEQTDLIIQHVNDKEYSSIIQDVFDLTPEETQTLQQLVNEFHQTQRQLAYDANQLSYDYKKNPVYRKLLQYYGSDIKRKKDPDVWINHLHREIKENLKKDPNTWIIITDARFENELNYLKQKASNLTPTYCIALDIPIDVRIQRLLQRDGFSPNNDTLYHKSDTNWQNFTQFDSRIRDTDKAPLELFKILNQQHQWIPESLNN